MNNKDNLDILTEQWYPRIHCSNCAHCIVSTLDNGELVANCDRGYGETRPLAQVIASTARGWRRASICGDFDNMGVDKEPYQYHRELKMDLKNGN